MNRAFQKGMSAYRDVGIKTRSAANDQHQLVAMMFDGLLESVTRAKGAVLKGDIPTKVAEIGRAISILQEALLTSLDLKNGGELANNLQNLYEYCVVRLTEANARNSVNALDEVAQLIKTVADAWEQMRPAAPAHAKPDPRAAEAPPASKAAAPPTASRVSLAYGAGLSLQGI